MKRAITLLGLVLVVQIVAVAVLWAHRMGSPTAASDQGPLLSFDRNAVDRINLVDGDGHSLEIDRKKGKWVVPAADGFPADGSKVKQLLTTLDSLKKGVPVAVSGDSRRRLQVGDDHFERRIRLKAGGDTVATVLLGDSAGARRLYARSSGADAIYAVRFGLWEAAPKAKKWLDMSVAGVDPSTVDRADLKGYKLVRKKDDWMLSTGDGKTEKADSGDAATLVTQLARPDVSDVTRAGTTARQDAVYRYTLDLHSGKHVTFSFYPGNGKDSLYLERDDQPWRYTVASKALSRVRKTDPHSLVAKGGKADATAGGGKGDAASGHG
ncbi:MAG TPA: DUF4340 domain-containing protein [Gammaproteobacteria bacterium]|nr:DUF4340 domain-containing protein [Gammaproteobacteria bacterium]